MSAVARIAPPTARGWFRWWRQTSEDVVGSSVRPVRWQSWDDALFLDPGLGLQIITLSLNPTWYHLLLPPEVLATQGLKSDIGHNTAWDSQNKHEDHMKIIRIILSRPLHSARALSLQIPPPLAVAKRPQWNPNQTSHTSYSYAWQKPFVGISMRGWLQGPNLIQITWEDPKVLVGKGENESKCHLH